MTKEQQKAAAHFGYSKATWDQTFEEEDFTKKVSYLDSLKKLLALDLAVIFVSLPSTSLFFVCARTSDLPTPILLPSSLPRNNRRRQHQKWDKRWKMRRRKKKRTPSSASSTMFAVLRTNSF